VEIAARAGGMKHLAGRARGEFGLAARPDLPAFAPSTGLIADVSAFTGLCSSTSTA